MTVVLITSSEIHIKNETLSLFFFLFFKVAALEKMKGRVCVWGGGGWGRRLQMAWKYTCSGFTTPSTPHPRVKPQAPGLGED